MEPELVICDMTETKSDQKWHLTDLPPEIIGEVVSRMSARDVESVASTCSYLRDAACANALWIRDAIEFNRHFSVPESVQEPVPIFDCSFQNCLNL